MVATFVIVLFASCDGDTQAVFFRRERTSGIWCDCTRGIVGPIKIEHHRAVRNRIGFQKATAGVGVRLASGIAKHKE